MSNAIDDPVHRAASIADGQRLEPERKHLREVIDYGARMRARWAEQCAEVGHTEACIVTLLGQALMMADAVEVLIAAGSGRAARANARAFFEAQLYAHWVMQHDTDRRALCWWAHLLRAHRKDVARCSSTTSEGQEISRLLRDAGLDPVALLNAELDQAAQVELVRLDARARRAPWADVPIERDWYRPAGAGSIRDVAKQVSQEHLYLMLYRPLCRAVHSSNPWEWLVLRSAGGNIEPIRSLRGVDTMLRFTFPLLYRLYRGFVARFLPDEMEHLHKTASNWPRLAVIRDIHINEEPDE